MTLEERAKQRDLRRKQREADISEKIKIQAEEREAKREVMAAKLTPIQRDIEKTPAAINSIKTRRKIEDYNEEKRIEEELVYEKSYAYKPRNKIGSRYLPLHGKRSSVAIRRQMVQHIA